MAVLRGIDGISENGSFQLSVQRILLAEFRSYRSLSLKVDPAPVILTGGNGAGKTNLLEALSLLAPGRGLRDARLTDLRRRGLDISTWAISAELRTVRGSIQIGTGSSAKSERTREVRIQGARASSQESLAHELHVFWLTPRMDRVFTDSPAGRRRFFDRLVMGFDPNHATRLSAYHRGLGERARLLRYRSDEAGWLDALEQTMSENAVAISAARQETLWRLNESLASPLGNLFPGATIELVGSVESWLEDLPALQVEERLCRAFAEARSEDAVRGGSSVGVHRTDLSVVHLGKDIPAEHCSTGEQKMILISIVLAHAQAQAKLFGQTPLILLDEVMAHLDSAHRMALTEALCSLGGQSWMTGISEELFSDFGSRAQFLYVSDGAVKRTSLER